MPSPFLIRRLLAPDAGPVAEFRGWSDLLERPGPHTWLSRRRATARVLLRPYVAFKNARAAVREFGPEVAALSGVPGWRQAAQLWWLQVRYDRGAGAYLEFQLYRPERRARAARYICEPEHTRVAEYLLRHHGAAGDGPRIRDKRTFPAWRAEHSLPTVPVLCEWANGLLVCDGLVDGRLPTGDLFSKPADLAMGLGAAHWRYDGQGGYADYDGRVWTAAELRAELAEQSRTMPKRYGRVSRRIILQPFVRNHPALASLTTGALCSVRMVTYRRPGGRAEFLVATFKMATGGAPVDNIHLGGVHAPVDSTTGRLGPALQRRGRVLAPIERHPDTGAPIVGHQLPDWEAVVALVRHAHDAARAVPLIGWDVALTPHGPVLIEGNLASNPSIAQAPAGLPLGDTPFVDAMNAHMRTAMGSR